MGDTRLRGRKRREKRKGKEMKESGLNLSLQICFLLPNKMASVLSSGDDNLMEGDGSFPSIPFRTFSSWRAVESRSSLTGSIAAGCLLPAALCHLALPLEMVIIIQRNIVYTYFIDDV